MAKIRKNQIDDMTPRQPEVGEIETFEIPETAENVTKSNEMIVNEWITNNEKWLKQCTSLGKAVNKFTVDFHLIPLLSSDLSNFEPSLKLRKILVKMLATHSRN